MSDWKFKKQKRTMAEHIRKQTHGGREIVQFMLDVMRGQNVKHLKTKDRLDAAKFLADRGWGRAVEQSVQLKLEAGHTSEVLDELPTSELVDIIRSLQAPSETTIEGKVLAPPTSETAEVIEVKPVDDNPLTEAVLENVKVKIT